MNKTSETFFKILSRAPISVTLIAFFFMPDTVPVHFGVDNNVDRWGSKYEYLILPSVILILSIVIALVSNYLEKKEENGNNNYKIMITVGICLLAVLNVMTYYFLYVAFMGVQNISTTIIDFQSLITLLLGFMLIVIGNIIPKAKMNSILGLRTKWSLSSEKAWKRSQRFCGYAAIISGLLIVIESLIFKGMTTIVVLISIIIVMSIVDTIYSYFVSKR